MSERCQTGPNDDLLRTLIESARHFAIIGMDAAGLVTVWNRGAETILGYSEQEIVGRPADVFFTPEDRAANAPEMERHLALVEGRAEDERWHQRKDGSRFWASGMLMPLRAAPAS